MYEPSPQAFAHPAVVARIHALIADPNEADALLLPWLRRFKALKDRSLRRTVLVEHMSGLDDGSLLGLIYRLEQRAATGEHLCRWMLLELALTPSALMDLPYERLIDLYAAARASGQDNLAQRFMGAHPIKEGSQEGNPHLEQSPGERTTAAHQTDRMKLDRLLHDRDLRVVRTLLDNPRIVERDVIRMAALRPTHAALLQYIAAHPRWGQNYRVRKALSFNPASPPALSRQILPTLMVQDLRELSKSQGASPELRADILKLLQAHPR